MNFEEQNKQPDDTVPASYHSSPRTNGLTKGYLFLVGYNRYIIARVKLYGLIGFSSIFFVLEWLGMVEYGFVWFGIVWYGLGLFVWFGRAYFSLVFFK